MFQSTHLVCLEEIEGPNSLDRKDLKHAGHSLSTCAHQSQSHNLKANCKIRWNMTIQKNSLQFKVIHTWIIEKQKLTLRLQFVQLLLLSFSLHFFTTPFTGFTAAVFFLSCFLPRPRWYPLLLVAASLTVSWWIETLIDYNKLVCVRQLTWSTLRKLRVSDQTHWIARNWSMLVILC